MSAEEAPNATEGKSVEEKLVEENIPAEVSEPSKLQDGTNGASEQTNSKGAIKPESATDVLEAESKVEPKVHVSAHERDREEQASRRVQEAQKYHNRDKRGRGGYRGGRGGYRNNSRFDPSKQEKSDDPVAIRKQVILLTSKKLLFC